MLHGGSNSVIRHHDENVVLVEQIVDFTEPGIDVAIEFVEEAVCIVLPGASRLCEVGMRQDVE